MRRMQDREASAPIQRSPRTTEDPQAEGGQPERRSAQSRYVSYPPNLLHTMCANVLRLRIDSPVVMPGALPSPMPSPAAKVSEKAQLHPASIEFSGDVDSDVEVLTHTLKGVRIDSEKASLV